MQFLLISFVVFVVFCIVLNFEFHFFLLLCRHVGEKAQLVVIKNAGHAVNVEKPKELYKNLKSFLIDPLTPSKQENHINGHNS